MSDRKAVIKNADMSEDMQQDAVECATQALEKYNIEKDIAAYIKKVSVAQHRLLKTLWWASCLLHWWGDENQAFHLSTAQRIHPFLNLTMIKSRIVSSVYWKA